MRTERKTKSIMDIYIGLLVQGLGIQVILFCIFHVVTMVTVLPSFNETPNKIKVHVGETAVLPCSIKNLGSREVIWKRKDQPHAITVGHFVFDNDVRYSVKHIPYKDEWNLVIDNVQYSHSGAYECQISTREVMERYVYLEVLNKQNDDQSRNGIEIVGPREVERGHPFVLTCNVTSYVTKPSKIVWLRDGIELYTDGRRDIYLKMFHVGPYTLKSELRVRHSRDSDAGVYICRSSPGLEVSQNHKLYVNSNNIKRGTENNPITDIHQRPESVNKNCITVLQPNSIVHVMLIVLTVSISRF